MVREVGSRVDDIYFEAHGESTCTAFLGFNALGMDRNDLRKKFGPPTMRETPPDEPDVNILSYELSDRDMTLAMHMRRSRGSREARVEKMILYKGRTGDNDNLSTSEKFDSDSKTDYEAPEDSQSDLPDETPEDLPSDLPEEANDLPDDSGSETKTAPKNISIDSQEKAAEILEGRLIDLGRIAPNETLEYSGITEINGVECWEFSAQFNFSETGRYAISSTGKIYEYDNVNDKFVPAK